MGLFTKKQQSTLGEMTDARFEQFLHGDEMPTLKEILQMRRYLEAHPEKKELWDRTRAERDDASSSTSDTGAPKPGSMQS